ncbi:MAG: M81 family metallopeptidase [Erysipelotrichaceae bacterium]|nr:M81 family metallopeptidase [Erysipelotrichaceae bacterium]
MKKVIIGTFVTESNENIPTKNDIDLYDIAFGDKCIDKMAVKEVFDAAGVEIIPSIYAVAGAAGVTKKRTFDYIETCFLDTVREHLHEVDGIYLMMHGASYVDGGIGSGDHHIVKEIRKITGPYLPITVACDPHGNMTKEYAESITSIRSYRHSPHTDAVATRIRQAQTLVDLMNDRQNVHSCFRKLPLILGGEQSVSADEPVASINVFMDEMEKDPRVRSASWHVGYLRHDCPEAGCSVVVVPQTEADQDYCEQKVDELAKFVWDRRHEFHYTGYTAEPKQALEETLAFNGKPCVITDSGDNTTSGAKGWNTYILRQALEAKPEKTMLFASIHDPRCEKFLESVEVGTDTHITLGVGHDYLSEPVELDVTVLKKGEVVNAIAIGRDDNYTVFGHCVTVHVKNTNIDIIVADTHLSFRGKLQFDHAGIADWKDYDVVVVKQGYIFPELKAGAAFYVMSLTDGPTPQNTRLIPFKLVMRPMFPLDNI